MALISEWKYEYTNAPFIFYFAGGGGCRNMSIVPRIKHNEFNEEDTMWGARLTLS